MRPPSGFASQLYPLRHRFEYRTLLDLLLGPKNSAIFTLVKNYKTVTSAKTVDVNPHHTNFVTDGGSVCQPMSIIDQLRLTLRFSLTESSIDTDKIPDLHVLWRPIFFSFPEKLDAADDETTTTVASILSLTKDATEEDVTPAHGGTAAKLVVNSSTATYPASTVNLTEVFGLMNLTTNTGPEGSPHDELVFQKAIAYYTNKGALKACVGATRHMTLSKDRASRTYRINKFVPRSIRRIVPYTFFGILVHLPVLGERGQYIFAPNPAATAGHVGVSVICNYHEWHNDFNQKMIDEA